MRGPLKGLVAAPHTPLFQDGSLAEKVIRRQARALQTAGIQGVFICGTTGEGMSLSSAERRRVAEVWCDAAGADLQVIVHVGHNSLPEAQDLAEHAAAVGADAISVTAPTFYRAESVDTLAVFCGEVADAAPDVPFFYYHIPAHTGIYYSVYDMLPALAARVPELAGIKYTHDDLMDCLRCMRWDGGRLKVFWGRDEMLLAALASGVCCAVGSTYNFAAPLYHRLIAAFEAGDIEAARVEQARSAELIALLKRYGGLPAGKAIMAWLGIDCGPVRPPLRTVSSEDAQALRGAIDSAGLRDALQWDTGLDAPAAGRTDSDNGRE